MTAHHRRAVLWGALALVVTWILALGGYYIASHGKVTPEKVSAYLESVDLTRLSGQDRSKALRELADMLNALNIQQRRRARFQGDWERWFEAMTEEEKASFIQATLPSGFKQMLTAFEQLPEDKRRQAIDRAMRDLDRTRAEFQGPGEVGRSWPGGTNGFARLSPELQQKVVKIGLNSFYTQSSAQTKAELAPVLEEMQRLMESGTLFRGGHR